HPFARALADLGPLELPAYGHGDRPATRDDDQPPARPESVDRLDGELEGTRLAEQAPADFEDGMHRRRSAPHEGNSSATAAAGAWRAAGPSRSAKWIT